MKQSDSFKDQGKHILQTKILPVGNLILPIVGVIFLLNQTSCSPLPNTESLTEEIPVPNYTVDATSIPTQAVYNWEGTMLQLDVLLPENPGEATLYQLEPEDPATLESARALAQELGMNGIVYEIPPGSTYTGKSAFQVVDGNQHLKIYSNLDFWYIPNYTRYLRYENNNLALQTTNQSDAARLIDEFLKSHGLPSAYELKTGLLPGDYYVFPLTSDGFAIQTSFFSSLGFSFTIDDDGILAVYAKMVDYQPIESYEIISPETALQRLVDHNTIYGVHVYTNSSSPPVRSWRRSYPENQSITLWGSINSLKSMNGNEPYFILDGYQAKGNLTGLSDITLPTFIEVTGQITDMNGDLIFNIENWQVNNDANWESGNIRREGDEIVFTNSKFSRLVLPDIPADLPLPFENAFVRGIIRGDIFDWKYIDNHMQNSSGQGGGGYVSPFHKLNLTGTPVSLAIPVLDQSSEVIEGQTNYSDQTGIIEEVELAYYLKNPSLIIPEMITEPIYIQPVWRFYGHFSGGDEFEIFVQALEDEFLSSELEDIGP